MSSTSHLSRLKRILTYSVIAAGLVLPTPAWADDAKDLLKAMSDFLVAQKTISFNYQSSLEAVTRTSKSCSS